MSTAPNWAARFGITDSDLADLQNQLFANEEPLSWILANGHIPSDDYTRWAMDEYGLPRVRDEFFEAPGDPVLWEAVKHEFSWTPYFYPLAEWQGVMLIGCLEPPSFHFPLHSPHRFVIAAAHTLEHRYRELERETVSSEPSKVNISPDFGPAAVATAVKAAPRNDVRQRPADEILADSLPPAPDVDLDDPDGLLFDVQSSSNINLMVVPDGMKLADLGKPVSSKPDGLEAGSEIIDMNSLDFSHASDEITNTEPILEAAASRVQPATHVPPASVTATSLPPRPPVVPPGPPAQAVKVAPAVVSTEQIIAAATATTHAQPVSMTAPPPPPSTATRSHVASSEPAVPLATCNSLEALSNAVVAHMTVHFPHAVLFNYENNVLKPHKWSELLLSVKGDSPDSVSLVQPSIFRVAARTSLPYHGYVVSNPTNDAFFNAFNRGLLPKHVTVMPVMIAGQLSGMLMGLSMEDVDYKGSLNAMEKLASEYSTQLDRLREKQQAA